MLYKKIYDLNIQWFTQLRLPKLQLTACHDRFFNDESYEAIQVTVS